MNLSTRRKKKITSLILIILMLAAVPLSVLVYRYSINTRSEASTELPQDIIISNTTSQSAVVSWVTTPNSMLGSVRYAQNESALDNASARLALDDRDIRNNGQSEKRITHYVTIPDLLPKKTYYFRILSGNKLFPAKDQPALNFKTINDDKNQLSSPTTIHGDIINTDLAGETIVYVTLDNGDIKSTPLSTITTKNNTWFLDITHGLKEGTQEIFPLTDKTKILLLAQAGNKGAKVESTLEFTNKNSLALNLEKDFPITSFLATDSQLTVTDNNNPSNINSTSPSSTTTRKPSNNTGISRQDAPLVAALLTNSNINSAILSLLPDIDTPTIANLTEKSFSVIWQTATKSITKACLALQSTSDKIILCQNDEHDDLATSGKYLLHQATFTELQADTDYKITIEQDNLSLKIKTPPISQTPPSFINISGYLSKAKGDCTILLITQNNAKTSHLIARVPDSTFNWNANLGPLRENTGQKYFLPQPSDSVKTEAWCANKDKILSGSVLTTVKDTQSDKVTVSLDPNLSKDRIQTNNEVYAYSILETLKKNVVLPETADSSLSIVVISLGMLFMSVGIILIYLQVEDSRLTQWEHSMLDQIH